MRTIESYLRQVGEALPQDLVTISEPVKPSQFEVTALLQHLENAGKFPLLLFENPLNLHGKDRLSAWQRTFMQPDSGAPWPWTSTRPIGSSG